MALTSATIPGQSGPGSNGNEGVLCIPQIYSITGTSPSDCLVLYPGYSLGGWGVLLLCREAVGVFYSPSRLSNFPYQVPHTLYSWNYSSVCPVGWGCRIHRLLLCRGVRPPPLTSVLDMTLNNLMVRFQQCWSFGECRVPLHCHRSLIHSGPEW